MHTRFIGTALAASILLGSCVGESPGPRLAFVDWVLFDAARQRPVPIRVYGYRRGQAPRSLAVISHGYGFHARDYSFLAVALVRRGYIVASIEHLERPGDPPMVNTGNLAQLRLPVWQIGSDSILLVIDQLMRAGVASQGSIVIGHSNGGDMTMLFAKNHPERTNVAISLDNRRMPLPRSGHPRICSVRSSNYPADPGVLPSPVEQAAFNIRVINVPVKHEDMWDGASSKDRTAVLKAVLQCLELKPSPD